jgi:hypothetical protein
MPDIDFSFFGRVPGNYAARVQWYSTLFPLGRVVYRAADLQEETKALIKAWRARVACLAEYGWQDIAGSQSLQSARNCCPAFAYTTPRTRCCRLRMLCPFCHARWVRDVWLMLEEALYGETLGAPQWYSECDELPRDEVPDLPTTCRFKLVERITKSKPLPYCADGESGPAHMTEWLQSRVFTTVKLQRAATLKALAATAGFHHTTIEPDKTGWKFRHRQLLLFPCDADLSHPLLQPDERRKVLVHESPTRTTLYRAVSRVCRYPMALMWGDPALVALLLIAKRNPKKVRLTATYGRFRGLLK